MVSAKERRHRGWITPKIAPAGKYSEVIAEANEPSLIFEPWDDGKDGIKYDKDNSHIRSEFMSFSQKEAIRKNNRKLRRLLRIRKARKKDK
jgi:hypothetical protein